VRAFTAWLRRHDTAPLDAAVALLAFALLAAECATNSAIQHPWVDLVWCVPFAGGVAWLRTRTVESIVVMLVAVVGMTFTGDNVVDFQTAFPVVMLLAFAAGAQLRLRHSLIALAAVLGLVVIVDLARPHSVVGDFIFPPSILAAWWLLGRFLRARHLVTSELRERNERLERERDELARAAADEERARVARELHDVVAHSMSVMVVQAGAARRVLDRSPDQSLAALRVVESTGRETLEELRRMLGALRPAGQAAELQPAPRLGDIDALVERARATGLHVDLQLIGEAPELPATTDLTIYRIVQEALTNALKHAGDTHAAVRIEFRAEDVVVDVRDTGPSAAASAGPIASGGVAGEGLGLIGMRERVELLGGELDAGPARGGFRVCARIPLDDAGARASAETEILPA
jgi:signal transduction histidine kinase